jgi:predicted transcriptional regulator
MARKSDAVSVRIPTDEAALADEIAAKIDCCRSQAIGRAIRDYHARVRPEAISHVKGPRS